MEIAALGTRMVYDVRLGGTGEIIMELETHRSGQKTTTATITQRYDPGTDRVYSHNESIEGKYMRVLKRV